MKKSTRIILICILFVLSIAIITFTAIGFSRSHKVYAESNTTILNFNQYFQHNPYSININTTNNARLLTDSEISIIPNHKIYIYHNAPSTIKLYGLFYTSNNTFISSGGGNNLIINVPSNASICSIQVWGYGQVNGSYYFNFIDLSQMYGIGLEPTLSQCQEIFTSQYYEYTTSSPIASDSFSLYNQAFNDIFSSYKYSLSQNALSYTTYAVQYKNQSANFDYNTSTQQWYFENTFAVPLFTTLNSGARITIDYYLYAYNLTQDWYLNVMYWNGNEYQTIYTSQETINTSQAQTMTFNLPYDTDTLYFNIVYNNAINTSANMLVFQFDISASQLDVNSMIHNAFQSGYDKCQVDYTYPNKGYMQIYNEGLASAQSGEVFTDSWGFVGSIFTSIGDILAIELIPNVPLGLFVALPLLVGLIFFIVKITKG